MNELDSDAKPVVQRLSMPAKDIVRRLRSNKSLHRDNYVEICDQRLKLLLNQMSLIIITPPLL